MPTIAIAIRRPARLAVTTFRPPIGALFPGARVSFRMIGSPAALDALTDLGDSLITRLEITRKLLTILIRRWDTSFHARTHGEEAAKAHSEEHGKK